MTRRDWLLLGGLAAARVGLGLARLGATPRRFWNFEESYNATVGWAVVHAPLLDQAMVLQYRSFCGGCSVVSMLGAPLLAGSDRLLVWKLVPLLWTLATQVIGFLALDAVVGRAAAWAFAVLYAVPMLGALDLSLMAWGNHQETALFAVAALALIARGRGGLAGVVLGFAVWFDRTAVYEAAVLVPTALWRLPAQRGRVLLGLAAGLLLLGVPAAGEDAGWYRMDDPVGGSVASMARRAATLFSPGPLASRLWFPLSGMTFGAGLLLAVVTLAVAWAWALPAARPVVGLGAAYALAYCVTQFPIFLIGGRMPVNNIRYHAPWAFLLTLVAAAGLGAGWSRGRRGIAGGLLACLLASNGWALAQVGWAADPNLAKMPAIDLAQFVNTAVTRLPEAALERRAEDPRGEALLARMQGLAAGHAVRLGDRDYAEAVRALAVRSGALEGLGEALVDPCDSAAEATARLARLDPGDRARVGRGIGATLGLCPSTRADPVARLAALRTADGCDACSAAGAAALLACGGAAARDPAQLGVCLAGYAALPDAAELYYGAGRAWADPLQPDQEPAAVVAPLGAHGSSFLAGMHDPAAGVRVPPFARERATPGVGSPRQRPGAPR